MTRHSADGLPHPNHRRSWSTGLSLRIVGMMTEVGVAPFGCPLIQRVKASRCRRFTSYGSSTLKACLQANGEILEI